MVRPLIGRRRRGGPCVSRPSSTGQRGQGGLHRSGHLSARRKGSSWRARWASLEHREAELAGRRLYRYSTALCDARALASPLCFSGQRCPRSAQRVQMCAALAPVFSHRCAATLLRWRSISAAALHQTNLLMHLFALPQIKVRTRIQAGTSVCWDSNAAWRLPGSAKWEPTCYPLWFP